MMPLIPIKAVQDKTEGLLSDSLRQGQNQDFAPAALAKFISESHGIQERLSGGWRNSGLGNRGSPKEAF